MVLSRPTFPLRATEVQIYLHHIKQRSLTLNIDFPTAAESESTRCTKWSFHMAIAWIATTTNQDLIAAFLRCRWDVKPIPPSEFVLAGLARVNNVHAIVLEMKNTRSVDMCQEICLTGIAPVLAIVKNLAYAQAALEAGVDDFIVVPVNPIEALLRVRKLTQASHVIRVGDLEIDLAARRVSYSGNSVRLSPVEFRLLACLAKRVGQMVTHAAILEEVWGWEAERGALAQVKSYIGRVRRKIEPDLNNPQYIISVPREGYRLRNQRQWDADRRQAVRSNMMR
jgi:DNA-binding response OmpR family regulator